jgi:hypothetical protein
MLGLSEPAVDTGHSEQGLADWLTDEQHMWKLATNLTGDGVLQELSWHE